ncbi:MAG: winged helix-turn-helix domain-containing protein [Alphaproteobacteria bacterium]|nr:winged helix-turn-helix domain-containing protein [Alphaproteobacteria bacterium]
MHGPSSANVWLFGEFRLDRRIGVLFRRDDRDLFAPLAMGSRALDILGVLVERPGELVSRAEIISAVWPGAAVEDSNLDVQIAALRRVLDGMRKEGSCIQTIRGRGYRFTAPVTRAVPDVAKLQAGDAPPLPDKPSLAVMPFQNMSVDSEQEYFADGMVEEIITALSRIRWLFVIARNSSFTYKGRAVDVKQVGRELGVRYVLEGAVRKAGNSVRISAQLIDATTGAHLWADRFDGLLEGIFELQDKVAVSVAGVIEPTLEAAETRRLADRPTHDLTALDLYLRALPEWDAFTKNGLQRALDLLGQAIARDPHYGPALAVAACCHQALEVNGWTEDPEATLRASVDLARRALRAGSEDPNVLALAGFVLGYFGGEIDVSLGLIDRCLVLNPSSARGWHWSGLLRVFAGQPDVAIQHFQNYLRLSPRDHMVTYLNGIGEAYFFSRRFDEAAASLLASLDLAPTFPVTYRVLASCYAHMGRLDDAREIVSRLRAITPAVMEPATRYRNPELRELFLSGLRIAAGETA